MRPPSMIVPPDMDGLYHVVSRVVDRRMIFGEEEQLQELPGTLTKSFYNGWNVELEHNGTAHTRRHTWGLDLSNSLQGAGGVGGLVMVEHLDTGSGPEPYFPTFDGNGNITAWVDANGTVVARQRYDAFGNILSQTGIAPSNYAFSTKPKERVTGLYYYGYRFYDHVTGRWVNRDPIEERGEQNLYNYVRNDGVGQFDVLGLLPRGQASAIGNLEGKTHDVIGEYGATCGILKVLRYRGAIDLYNPVFATFDDNGQAVMAPGAAWSFQTAFRKIGDFPCCCNQEELFWQNYLVHDDSPKPHKLGIDGGPHPEAGFTDNPMIPASQLFLRKGLPITLKFELKFKCRKKGKITKDLVTITWGFWAMAER